MFGVDVAGMGPLEHARRASRLLESLENQERELAEMTPEDRLSLSIGARGFNADRHWTLELAIAHALTAIALK